MAIDFVVNTSTHTPLVIPSIEDMLLTELADLIKFKLSVNFLIIFNLSYYQQAKKPNLTHSTLGQPSVRSVFFQHQGLIYDLCQFITCYIISKNTALQCLPCRLPNPRTRVPNGYFEPYLTDVLAFFSENNQAAGESKISYDTYQYMIAQLYVGIC